MLMKMSGAYNSLKAQQEFPEFESTFFIILTLELGKAILNSTRPGGCDEWVVITLIRIMI